MMELKEFKSIVSLLTNKRFPGYKVRFLVEKIEDRPDVIFIETEFDGISFDPENKVVEIRLKQIYEEVD